LPDTLLDKLGGMEELAKRVLEAMVQWEIEVD
jgi:hypothetical protein